MEKVDVTESNFEKTTTLDKQYIASTSNLSQDAEGSALSSILINNLSEHENFDCENNCDVESSDNDYILEDINIEFIDIQEALKE